MINLWERIKSALPTPTRAQAYEGATHGRRATGWNAPSTGPNQALNPALATLRNRSRQAYRNNPWIQRAIDRNVSNEVGTGTVPMFDSLRAAAYNSMLGEHHGRTPVQS